MKLRGGSLGTISGGRRTATIGPTATQFPSGVPDGMNVAAVDNGASISQTLQATLTDMTDYTLKVSAGQRAGPDLLGRLVIRPLGKAPIDGVGGEEGRG